MFSGMTHYRYFLRLKILNVLTSVVCSYKSLFYSVDG